MFDHAIRHVELLVGVAAVKLLRQPHLVGPERLAMRLARVVPVRRTITDVAVDNDQGRPVRRMQEGVIRRRQQPQVVGIRHPQHLPAVSFKACPHVLGEGDAGGAFDRDAVVVIDPAQVGQLQMPGQRRGLAGDAFHHVAIAAQRIDAMVVYLEARPVVGGRQPASGDRHADAVRHALPERAGRGFDSGSPAVLRVAGAAAADLPEALQVVQRHRQPIGAFIARGRRLDPA